MACAASSRGRSAASSLSLPSALFTSASTHSPSYRPASSLSPLYSLAYSLGKDSSGLRSAQLSRSQLSRSQLSVPLTRTAGVPSGALSFFSTWKRQNSSKPITATRATRGGRKKGGYQGLSKGGDEDDEAARHRKKWEAINDTIARVNDEFGKGTVVPLDNSSPISDVKFFSTGILPLDLELQGGWPVGRIVEIYGHESSGKTSLALYAIAEMQKRGEAVLLIDAEHALDMQYAKALGVVTEGPERLVLAQPNSGEHAINVADTCIRSGNFALVVIDSVSALVPQAELEGLAGEGALGSLARLMSQAMRKLSPAAAKAGCTVIFINQIRNKIGVYGNPETTSGGLALKFHASVRCELKIVERKKALGEEVGVRVRVRVVKSKVSAPYREAEFEMTHGHGVQREGAVVDAALKMDLITKKASYYYLNGEGFHGKESMVQHLRANPEVLAGLEGSVREAIKAGRRPRGEDALVVEEEEEELFEVLEDLEGVPGDLGLEEGSR